MENFDPSKLKLSIDNSSLYALENELIDYPRQLGELHRVYSQAVKRVDRLTLELEVLSATILDEILKTAEERGKPYPPSSLQEVRRNMIPKDRRYKRKKLELIEAIEEKNILGGLVKAFEAKGYRLQELITLSVKRTDFAVR